jgi:hypothetical protein
MKRVPAASLSAAQREAFREQGFFSLGKPFTPSALAEIAAEYDRLLARPMKIGRPGHGHHDRRGRAFGRWQDDDLELHVQLPGDQEAGHHA